MKTEFFGKEILFNTPVLSYDEELGGEGKRVIFSFKDTVDPARQAEIKIATNETATISTTNI